jgi:hypothetical protein
VVTNPWYEEFPELINENNLVTSITNADFVGVKIGDVNGTARANLLSGDDRTLRGCFDFEVEDINLRSGNVYTIAFRGRDMANVAGYQATLTLQGIELVTLEYSLATAANFGLRFAEAGMITTSWNQDFAAEPATDEDVLFSLVVRATANIDLHDALGINSRYTAAEAYRAGQTTDVGIHFTQPLARGPVFELYQNTPNPFQGETLISFNLPEDATATVTIRDVAGKLIRIIKGDYAAGYNSLKLTRQEMNGATGVLSYTVTAGEYTATRKMIVVE